MDRRTLTAEEKEESRKKLNMILKYIKGIENMIINQSL